LTANAERVLKGKAVNIQGDKKTFDTILKKAATPKQRGLK